tara:strand:+ start:452 stop:655 length:204 start_codon:yes stop_codon:yes gene_type:complete
MTDDSILIENAVLAFLHNYPEHHWVDQYNDLLKRLKSGQYPPNTVQKRGRPAKRQRTQKATSDKAST